MTTIEQQNRPSQRSKVASAVALAAAAATVSVLVGPGAALASGGRPARTSDVTFTKRAAVLPAGPSALAGALMVGVIAGDVGPGRFVGQVLDDRTAFGFWLGHARYEFHGRRHSFTAIVDVVEDDKTTPVTAAITGVVTAGWLKGARVTGGYAGPDRCPLPRPDSVYVYRTSCFQGTLHLHLP